MENELKLEGKLSYSVDGGKTWRPCGSFKYQDCYGKIYTTTRFCFRPDLKNPGIYSWANNQYAGSVWLKNR